MSTKSAEDAAEAIRKRSRVDAIGTSPSKPGPVQPKAVMRLHTYLGHQLFFGKQEESNKRAFRSQSFVRFASNVNALWDCARQDDPYADARLILIEEKINEVREQVKALIVTLDELLESMSESGIRADSHSSVQPVEIPLSLRSVHATVAVQILGSVDRLIQKALAAKHFGLVTDQDWQRIMQQSVSPMRALMQMGQFKASGATRSDFASKNARARAAVEKLGELPPDVLDGSRRPALGPRPSKSLVFSGVEDAKDGDSLVSRSLKALEAAREEGEGTAVLEREGRE